MSVYMTHLWKVLTLPAHAVFVFIVVGAFAQPHLAFVVLLAIAVGELAVRTLRAVAVMLASSCRTATK